MKMKKLLAGILAGAMVVGSVMSVSAADVISSGVGETDLSTGWWVAFSDSYKVEAGSSASVAFYNYSDCVNNWDNFVVALVNMDNAHSTEDDASYAEYLVVRADNYGWGTYYDENNNTNNYDWDNYKTLMNGSYVVVTVSRDGDTVTILANVTGSDGVDYYQQYVATISADEDIYFFLTCEAAYLSPTALTSDDDADDTEEEEGEAEETVEETVTTATTGEASTIVLFMVAMVAIAGTAFTMKKAR